MNYRLDVPIRGTLSETVMGVSEPVPLSGEALAAYQREIQNRMQNVMQDEPDAERMNPVEASGRFGAVVDSLRIDAVVVDGKLKGCIQVAVTGKLTAEEEKKLEAFIKEQFAYGVGEMFPPVKVPEGWVHFELEPPESCAFLLQKKYEITNIRHPCYAWLFRIRALTPVNESVGAGALGGFVESGENLSQEGSCWIYDDAICCEDAVVDEDARLFDGAMARGSALVTGDAELYFRATADDYSVITSGEIKDEARIAGYAIIGKNHVTGISPLIQKNSNVYGNVNGAVIVGDNVYPGEKIENPTPDMFILEHGVKNVLVNRRKLKAPERDGQKKEKQRER